eukprot:SAG22_NODE_1460_length_4373_cov_4.000702_2_plen_509_part_00
MESRFESRHMRCTAASYLFPLMYPDDPENPGHVGEGFVGFRPKRTRLGTLPLRYATRPDSPLLAELERAVCDGAASEMLRHFGMFEQRHSPLHGMSTGEARKLMLVGSLLQPPRLLVLDEAFDGLDVVSRRKLRDLLGSVYDSGEYNPWTEDCHRATGALVLIAHRPDDLVIEPTHALLLGQGDDGTGYCSGEWASMAPVVDAFFSLQRSPARPVARAAKRVQVYTAGGSPPAGNDPIDAATEPPAEALVAFRGVTVAYPPDKTVFDRLHWTVQQGEKWVVVGGNGSGKSTLLELITGDNLQGYREPVWLFGRKKGSGASIWEIKQQLGVISTKFHMEYADYTDPSRLGAPGSMTSWDVVCSGFFDSIGLYEAPGLAQEKLACEWVQKFGLSDLVSPPPPGVRRIDRITGKVTIDRGARRRSEHAQSQEFRHLSFGQQKLVLLCRAMVKQPRLLLLDEPTHGLQGDMRDRLLDMLSSLVGDPQVTIVYVSHHQDEIDSLGFENVLRLS